MSKTIEKVSSSDMCPVNQSKEQIPEETCGFQIGCGRCRSKRFLFPYCGCSNNAKFFLFIVSVAVFVQGQAVYGLMNTVVSTIEKRFNLHSSEIGLIAGCFDLGFLITIPLVTYIGGRRHKPRWIGWSVLLIALGSLIFSLPHFVAPTHQIPQTDFFSCGSNETHRKCGESHLRSYIGWFIVGRLLHGIGTCSLMILPITYIDANVKKSKTSLYHGVFFACLTAGQGIGYIAGGALIRLYTNLGERIAINEESNHWVGNWWLGFIICGVILLLLAMPITFFPKQLPNTAIHRQNRDEEIHQTPDALKALGNEKFGKSLRDVPRCLKVVFKNWTLTCVTIAEAMDSGAVVAIGVFIPKVIEGIYRIPASSAGIFLGAIMVVSSCASNFLGGYIISKWKLEVKAMIQFCVGCAILTLCCAFGFLFRCENPDVPGVTIPYNSKSTHRCNESSDCSTEMYDPVCGADNLTYLSLCDAGCTVTDSGAMINCTRMVSSNDNMTLLNATAALGKCQISTFCPPAVIEMGIGGLFVFFTMLKFQPALQVSLRTVPFHQRSFAMGIRWILMKCLGLIPLPLILGRLLDDTCLVWEEVCGEFGACRLHDNNAMANSLTILIVCTKIISISFLTLAVFVYKPSPSVTGNENNRQSDNEFYNVNVSNGMPGKGTNALELQSHYNQSVC